MYYVKINNKTFGPLAPSVVREMVASGRLQTEDEIRKRDGEWMKAGQMKGLFSAGPNDLAPESPLPPALGGGRIRTTDISSNNLTYLSVAALVFGTFGLLLCWIPALGLSLAIIGSLVGIAALSLDRTAVSIASLAVSGIAAVVASVFLFYVGTASHSEAAADSGMSAVEVSDGQPIAENPAAIVVAEAKSDESAPADPTEPAKPEPRQSEKSSPAGEPTPAKAIAAAPEPMTAQPAAAKPVVAKPAAAKPAGYDFRRVNWGMTRKQVLDEESKLASSEIVVSKEDYIGYNETLIGEDVYLIYYFVDDKLVRAKYALSETYGNAFSYYRVYERFCDAVAQVHGDASVSEKIWSDDLYKDDISDWGMAIVTGRLFCVSKWNLDSATNVSVFASGENYEANVAIVYLSKQLKHLEAEADQVVLESKLGGASVEDVPSSMNDLPGANDVPSLGFTYVPMDKIEGGYFLTENQPGTGIVLVEPGPFSLQKTGIKPGDVVLTIDGAAMLTSSDISKWHEKVKADESYEIRYASWERNGRKIYFYRKTTTITASKEFQAAESTAVPPKTSLDLLGEIYYR